MRVISALFSLFLLATHAFSQERITRFSSNVMVNADASLNVTESISVVAEGVEIRHGIFRDFPTTYTTRDGRRVSVGFHVSSVKLDGRDEDYTVESISGGKRVKIGSANRFVAHGSHAYVLTYTTDRQLGFFDSYDELYWNVTGNRWQFPMQKASVTVHLPEGAAIKQHAEYTGPEGSSDRAANASVSGNIYRAETTAELAGYEGFTVAVAWQKGIVTPPGDIQRTWWVLRDYAWAAVGGLTLLIAGLYFLFAWSRVGRDPPQGTIIPLFTPPPALGPAGARYVWTRGFDNKGFAAALVGLAVKGCLKIAEESSGYSITKITGQGREPLMATEAALFGAVPGGTTELEDSNHAKVGAMRKSLAKSLAAEFEGAIFLRNLGWFWIGAAISAAGLIASALLLPGDEGIIALFVSVFLTIWWGVVLTVAWGALKGLAGSRGILAKLRAVIGLLFLIPFIGAGIGIPTALSFVAGVPKTLVAFGVIAVLAGALNLLFYHLMSAPTPQGRKVLDHLEGFRMYMKTAEEQRLNVLNPPDKTPELFERYLPYALALDCENEWNEKFTAVLAAAAAAGATAPIWYSGSSWNSSDMGGFTDSLGSSLASSAGAASSPPGSSSGSGGGGSSGGGGGGGGGGGW